MEKKGYTRQVIKLVILIITLLIYPNTEIKANDSVLESHITSQIDEGYGFFYQSEHSSEIEYYSVSNGKIKGKTKLSVLVKEIKKGKYALFQKAQGTAARPFPSGDTRIVDDKIKGSMLSGESIYGGVNLLNRREESDNLKIDIGLDKEIIRIQVPPNSYILRTEGVREYWYYVWELKKNAKYDNDLVEATIERYETEYKINQDTQKALKEIKKAVEQGIVAGSVEASYNIGSVYSERQIPLKDVMIEEDRFYKFKENISLEAGLDYLYNPIFGQMYVTEGVPRTEDEWDEKAKEIDLTSGYIEIDEGYKSFITGEDGSRQGIYEVESGIKFENGVKKYSRDVNTKEPKKMVSYDFSIALPHKFAIMVGSEYKFEENSLYILEDIRIGLNNDRIYDISEGREEICTINDLDLGREHLVLYHKKVEGEPVGVVVVLKYNEAVIDTRAREAGGVFTEDGITEAEDTSIGEIYLTGRTVVLDNSYSDALNLEEENRDKLSIRTRTQGIQGIKGKFFAFPYDMSPTHEEMSDIENHREVIGENISLQMNFIKEDIGKGFFIIRNNSYIQDNRLLAWLSTSEARTMAGVKAEELENMIKGVFKGTNLTFYQWMRVKDIESYLTEYKNNFLFRVINVILIVSGALMVVLGILFIFAYWFDVFNTFTEFSILYFISFRSIYPVASDTTGYKLTQDRKYVTFKDVMLRASLLWIIGVMFLENEFIIKTIVKIYLYIKGMIGG